MVEVPKSTKMEASMRGPGTTISVMVKGRTPFLMAESMSVIGRRTRLMDLVF